MRATDSHGLLLQRINNIVTTDSITHSGYLSDRKTVRVSQQQSSFKIKKNTSPSQKKQTHHH